jgi:hypothetical protein
MTANQFNEKYKAFIPEGWGGLEFDIPEVTDMLDVAMDGLVKIPKFELHQIKLKFGMVRFYSNINELSSRSGSTVQHEIESEINHLVKQHDEKTQTTQG